ncbi:hypothetical protein B0T10DRAFT_545577 [Thelonectria olida]|uniref:Uncharacterized protein n=1 Tax=Thelonectria olida TaxID=1576542 RepID=A0A9P8WFA2_9HYPO|nr:hypothetical protein B0T10DRAFT_545577 [Thelonectria olida]
MPPPRDEGSSLPVSPLLSAAFRGLSRCDILAPLLTMSAVPPLKNKEIDGQVQHVSTAQFDFEFHYEESSNIGGVLTHILADLASFKQPQNWDNAQRSNYLKILAANAHRYLFFGKAGELINCSTAEDVSILNDTVTRQPAILDSSTAKYFFPLKFNLVENDTDKAIDNGTDNDTDDTTDDAVDQVINEFMDDEPEDATDDNTGDPPGHTNDDGEDDVKNDATTSDLDLPLELRCSRGRIVQIEETASLIRRAPLLLLHVFCLRLQNEDTAFIREFIQRHVGFTHTLKRPSQFQPMTPSDTEANTRICYRRLSYSCHIPHFLLQDINGDLPLSELPDLKLIEAFKPLQSAAVADSQSLCQLSSSVLLTFFLPEESTSRREELDFLTASPVLWNILTINCIRRRRSNLDENYTALPTPIAQFLGGIHGALQTQRVDEQNIMDALKARLADLDDMSLFDDEDFTKSHLYHWVVKTCDMVCHSISSTLRFVDKTSNSFLKDISAKAHASERPGIEFWSQKWTEAVSDLEELREEFLSCRQDVQERRNALHGATAVLEARLALQQGQRVKVLTYLAIIYLPLGTAASIYSINPLPESATLVSFFVFLVVLLLATALMGVGITNLMAQTSAVVRNSATSSHDSWKSLRQWLKLKYWDRLVAYSEYLKEVLTPPSEENDLESKEAGLRYEPPAEKYWVLYIPYAICYIPLHFIVIPWMAWPRTLLHRALYCRSMYGCSWNFLQAIRDAFIILLSPVAVILFLLLTSLLVLIDITAVAWQRVTGG